jgi:hypothetical protein
MTVPSNDELSTHQTSPVIENDREDSPIGASPDFIEIIENARAEFNSGKTLSLEDMKREILGDL